MPSAAKNQEEAPRRIHRVENNTAKFIVLPATKTYPRGIILRPGMNTPDSVPGLQTVPGKYIDELTSRKVVDAEGQERSPGRELLEQLTSRVRIITSDGTRWGAQITLYDDAQVERPDGIIPESIAQYSPEAAEAMIRAISDKEALRRWSTEREPTRAAAAAAKLQSLGG
jgi:hypothetical protein